MYTSEAKPGRIEIAAAVTGYGNKARVRNIELIAQGDGVRLSVDGYWRQAAKTIVSLDRDKAIELGHALLFLSRESVPGAPEGKITTKDSTYAKVVIEMEGDIFCLRDGRDVLRAKLHEALDKQFTSIVESESKLKEVDD